LQGCNNDSVRIYECISDNVDVFKGERQKITVTIDKEKIVTSNNFIYSYCGDSKEEIIGSSLSNFDKEVFSNRKNCDGSNTFFIDKEENKVGLLWWEIDDIGSGRQRLVYGFEGNCTPKSKYNPKINRESTNSNIAIEILTKKKE
jgi:hypothetical protein